MHETGLAVLHQRRIRTMTDHGKALDALRSIPPSQGQREIIAYPVYLAGMAMAERLKAGILYRRLRPQLPSRR